MNSRLHTPFARGMVARLSLLTFLDGLAQSVSFPVLPRLVSSFLEGDPAMTALWVGWLEVAWALPQIFMAPILGALSDRFGRRPLMLLSMGGVVLELLLDALAQNLGWLLAGRFVCGLTFGSQAAVMAGVADTTPPDERARAYGFVNGAFYAAIVVGPLLGGWLAEANLRAPFHVGAAVAAVGALYVVSFLPEPLAPVLRTSSQEPRLGLGEAFRLLGTHPTLRPLAVVLLLSWLSFQSSDNMSVLYTAHRYGWSTVQFGAFVAVEASLGILVQGLVAGAAARRLGERRALILGTTLQGLGMLAMGLAPVAILFWPGALVAVMGAIARPALQTLMSEAVHADEQGRLQGIVSSIASATSVVAPLVFTSLYAWAIGGDRSPAWAGITLLCGAALCALGAWVAWRTAPRRQAPPPPVSPR
ncbi:MFS transporter [Archangium violaceum]|uniref:MFS transporter n=1 Tax=Archangium violaceum TaxID=83451 RepID=UPI0006984665|nr:MFS transporter [Archangium violaceum]